MKAEKIIELAEEMRRLQRAYFAGNRGVLSAAKNAEKKLDEAIKTYREKNPIPQQQNLFHHGQK